MPLKALHSPHHAAIAALLSESTIEAAAAKAKVGLRSLKRWLKDPLFQRSLRQERRTRADLSLSLLERFVNSAVIALGLALRDDKVPAAVRVRAAREVLQQTVQATTLAGLQDEVDDLRQMVENGETSYRVEPARRVPNARRVAKAVAAPGPGPEPAAAPVASEPDAAVPGDGLDGGPLAGDFPPLDGASGDAPLFPTGG